MFVQNFEEFALYIKSNYVIRLLQILRKSTTENARRKRHVKLKI